jgi:hypothetical protein
MLVLSLNGCDSNVFFLKKKKEKKKKYDRISMVYKVKIKNKKRNWPPKSLRRNLTR